MRHRRLAHLIRLAPRAFLLLLWVAAVGAIQFTLADSRALLSLYIIPVAFAAYRYGRGTGLMAAAYSITTVAVLAAFGHPAPIHTGLDWRLALELATWTGSLGLVAVLVGSLRDQKQAQLSENRDAYQGVLELMTTFIDAVDPETESHSRRVADSSVDLARTMGLEPGDIESIRVGAWLHDLGKVDISLEVLKQGAGLTPEEITEMQRQVHADADLASSASGVLIGVIPMIAYHHERWDGTGSKGIQGAAIPIGARIIAITDAFDAMVSDRPYHKGRTREEAIAIIQHESGAQFDPAIAGAFVISQGAPALAIHRRTEIEWLPQSYRNSTQALDQTLSMAHRAERSRAEPVHNSVTSSGLVPHPG